MPISLADLNAVLNREVVLPWFRQVSADFGIPLPKDWNPDDAELERLAARLVVALRNPYGEAP